MSNRACQEVPRNSSYREATPKTHAQFASPQNNQPKSSMRGAHTQASPHRGNQGGTNHRRIDRQSPQRGRYSEKVVTTPTKGSRNSPKPVTKRNDELDDNPTAFSAREIADMKKMIKWVLQQNKLLPVSKEQSWERLPFVANVMEKPLPRKFKMPQITLYLAKDDPYDHV